MERDAMSVDEPWHNPGCHTFIGLLALLAVAVIKARKEAKS
jgi:hypothetical protein